MNNTEINRIKCKLGRCNRSDRDAIFELFKQIITDGNLISVDNINNGEMIYQSNNLESILYCMTSSSCGDFITITTPKNVVQGFIHLIYYNSSDNDPMTVIDDYTVTPYLTNVVSQVSKLFGGEV